MVNAGGYISLGFALRTTRDKRNKRGRAGGMTKRPTAGRVPTHKHVCRHHRPCRRCSRQTPRRRLPPRPSTSRPAQRSVLCSGSSDGLGPTSPAPCGSPWTWPSTVALRARARGSASSPRPILWSGLQMSTMKRRGSRGRACGAGGNSICSASASNRLLCSI